MNLFEGKIVNLINKFCEKHNYLIHCRRNIQNRFCTQYIDINLDCGSTKCYIGIECKRVRTEIFYFSRYFDSKQIITISEYLRNSGRKGFLALSYKKIIAFIPWEVVLIHIILGLNHLSSGTIVSHTINFEKDLELVLDSKFY